MNMERWIECAVWPLSMALLVWLVPRHRRREAALSVIFMQFLAWIFGLIVVELHLLSYPVRIFTEATRTNLTFEYCALPTVSAIYNVRYPAKGRFWLRAAYAAAFPTVLAAAEWPIATYTDLLEYERWNLGMTWLSEFAVLQACYRFYKWFFRVSASSSKTARAKRMAVDTTGQNGGECQAAGEVGDG
ncbi:CBO0543 family protein [Cohnella sp. JJ-181]|uniref:CBO0543 family protein n=1 Tax=Cohnella rhizoplanae TaxID=2974897 RepID=UPI0022FF8832|nr:CBO0543 family protein [Cohnella sp. JJ-181]CAI6047902.1 hypothetical protein COHCIP112018_01354 [Cohnella sp. JJ-181]